MVIEPAVAPSRPSWNEATPATIELVNPILEDLLGGRELNELEQQAWAATREHCIGAVLELGRENGGLSMGSLKNIAQWFYEGYTNCPLR